MANNWVRSFYCTERLSLDPYLSFSQNIFILASASQDQPLLNFVQLFHSDGGGCVLDSIYQRSRNTEEPGIKISR